MAEGAGAAELLAAAAGQLEAAAGLDPGLRELAERLAALQYEAADLGGELNGYLAEVSGDVEGGPARLEEIESRLALLARLERKHGGTVADVLAHAERCQARRDELAGADSELDQVAVELERELAVRDELAGQADAGPDQGGTPVGQGGTGAAG